MNPFQSSENVFPHSCKKTDKKIINTSRKGWVMKREVYLFPNCSTLPQQRAVSELQQMRTSLWWGKESVLTQSCDSKQLTLRDTSTQPTGEGWVRKMQTEVAPHAVSWMQVERRHKCRLNKDSFQEHTYLISAAVWQLREVLISKTEFHYLS